MRFTAAHCDSFQHLSHDANPLHVDAAYARRSQYGQRVVHGVAAVLWILGQWSGGRRFQLESLSAAFNKPIFLEQDYQLEFQENGDQVVARLFKARVLRTRVQFTWKAWNAEPVPRAPPASFEPLSVPAIGASRSFDEAAYRDRARQYRLNSDALGEVEATFGLSPDSLPLSQLQVLAWSSYFVGMELPGRQALFTDLRIAFSSAADGLEPFNLDTLHAAFDERFGQVSITASSPAARSIEIAAFERPAPVNYDLDEIRSHVEESQRFTGRTVAITGASRGFGSVLAVSFALQGADQILVMRNIDSAALELQRMIESMGRACRLIEADVSDESACARLADAIATAPVRPDLLILNAWPTPPVLSVRESTADDLLSYVNLALATAVRPLSRLLPLLSKDLLIVNVSTIFVSRPEPNFTAYVASKAALEAMLSCVALENKALRVLNVRLPRMLTDTTNVVQRTREPASAAQLAARVLDEIDADTAPGFRSTEVDP